MSDFQMILNMQQANSARDTQAGIDSHVSQLMCRRLY